MECIIRFAQAHESFRKAEIEALAVLAGIDVEFLVYTDDAPFGIVRVKDENAARTLISRSILARGIYELWGQGETYDELHEDIRRRTESRWPDYKTMSFKFHVDSYASKRSTKEKIDLIQSFAYLGFDGPIKMVDPDEHFYVFEEYPHDTSEMQNRPSPLPKQEPKQLYMSRWLGRGSRDLIDKYDLKKRKYISTTSMDAELSLVTANMSLAAEGKMFYDPFVGTGSFCVAAAHFGAHTFGSDIDGRSFRGRERGKGKPIGLIENMKQYKLKPFFVDAFTSDLTNTPLRDTVLFDGIVCDPPYGVREGLKVLGSRNGPVKEISFRNGVPMHCLEDYVAPKRQYSFEALLDDILEFASQTLVRNGRISFWMPTADEEEVELDNPSHPHFELVSVCTQPFTTWSRRLLTYRRLPLDEVSGTETPRIKRDVPLGKQANELNAFRKKYFEKSRVAQDNQDNKPAS